MRSKKQFLVLRRRDGHQLSVTQEQEAEDKETKENT